MTDLPAAEASPTVAARLRLRLLGVTDIHANLFAYDYYRDRPDDTVGLARAASLIAAARAEAPNSVLFDNGDILQGTPLGDYAAQTIAKDRSFAHPVVAAMNALGYAAATLGNHEFNYGLDVLEAAYAKADFPVVCCNIFCADGSPYVKPWVVLERSARDDAGAARTLRIGVIGFAPPQIAQWDEAHVRGRLTMTGIVETARIEVPKLRSEGVDLVVALCHSGLSRSPSTPGQENAALDLAAVEGIDALFLGHQHLLLPGADFAGIAGVDVVAGAVQGKPAVMAGFWGSHLGVVDLALERSAAGWRVADAKVEARPIYRRDDNGIVTATVGSDESVLAASKAAHEATLTYVRAPVGRLASPLHTYFALIADDPSIQLVNAAQLDFGKTLVAARADLANLPILAAASPFKCGGRGGPDYYTDISPGPIAIKDVADIYPFPNTLRILKIDGAAVGEFLERSAAIFRRIDPAAAAPQPLFDRGFTSYNFDVIDGVSYEVDVTQPARYDDTGKLVDPRARRIRELRFAGAPIDPRQMFLVVTNNYRASGGGGFPGCASANVVIEAQDDNRSVLMRYIAAQGLIAPKTDGNWRLARWPASAVVVYETAPAAAGVPPPEGVKATNMGAAAGGFLSFRIETV